MSAHRVMGATAIAVLIVAAACQTTTTPSASPSPSAMSSPSVSATTPSPTPTPTPSPSASPAETSVRGFWATLDEIAAATDAPPQINKLAIYGRDSAFTLWSGIVMRAYGRGEHQVGKTVILTSTTKTGATATQVIVTVCLDTSGVDVVDKDGKSMKSPNAVGRSTAVHSVEQDLKDGRWYVMTYEGRQGC